MVKRRVVLHNKILTSVQFYLMIFLFFYGPTIPSFATTYVNILVLPSKYYFFLVTVLSFNYISLALKAKVRASFPSGLV